MDFTLQELIDKTRQRLMTDQEIVLAERRARRMELGIASLERWQQVESTLIPAAIKKAADESGVSDPAIISTFDEILRVILRQVAFASGSDDATRLVKNLESVHRAFWKSPVPTAFVSLSFEHLRDALKKSFPVAEFNQVDRMIRLEQLSLVSLCSFAGIQESLIRQSLDDLFKLNSKWEVQDASLRRRLQQFAETLMQFSARALLPEGGGPLADLIARTNEKIKRDRLFAMAIVELLGLMMGMMRSRELNRYHLKTNHLWLEVQRSLKVALVLNQTRDAISQSVWKKLSDEFRNGFEDVKEAEKAIKQDSYELLAACVILLTPSGTEKFHKAVLEVDRRIYRYKFQEAIVQRWLHLLQEESARIMGAEAFGDIAETLEQSCTFILVAGDFATKRAQILVDVAQKLADEFPEVFERKARYLSYVIRDHEALLDSVYQTLLPQSELTTLGRIAIFGDVLIADKFPKKLMFRSFELLEAAVAERFTDRVAGVLQPRLEAIMRYLRVCVELATTEEKILKDATEPILAQYKDKISSFKNGETKVRRDARTFFRSALASIIPGNEYDLTWGHDVLFETLQDRQFDEAMMNAHINSLIASVKSNLDAETCAWLVPILDRCRKFTVAASALASKEEKIIDQTVKTVLEKHPHIALSHASASRHLSRDFSRLFRFSLLSLFQKGQEKMAHNLDIFYDVIVSEELSVSYIRDCYEGIRNAVKINLNADAASIWMEVLNPSCQAIITTAEVIDRAPTFEGILSSQTAELSANDKAQLATITRLCLQAGALTSFRGGQVNFARELRKEGLKLAAHETLTPEIIWKVLSELHLGAQNFLEGESRNLIANAFQSARDYLSLQSKVSRMELELLKVAVEKARAKGTGPSLPQNIFQQDGRYLLQAALLSLIPGCDESCTQIRQTLSTIYRHHRQGNHGVITSTLEHMKATFQQEVKVGPVGTLNAHLDSFAKSLAA